jgi:hypothetical protein
VPYVIALVVLVVIIALLVQYWYIVVPIALVIALAIVLPRIIRHVRMRRYFASEAFLAHKTEIASVVAEHNEIASYVAEIRGTGSFGIGKSSTGSQASLATFQNTSRYAYRRDRNVAQYSAPNVHNCSLQVVRNAAGDPLKYVIKYFDIAATDTTLADVEGLGQRISRLEDAVRNLKQRENAISNSFNPPAFILKHYANEFMGQVGVKLSPVTVPYPEYVFEYVSAGGNSSQRTSFKLDTSSIDALLAALSQKMHFSKSVAGQRALMTASLRESIKRRDDYACKYCLVSVAVEPHLLLEVDHIVPVSRGGLSTVANLQTLCWRCNRSKSNKVPSS